MTRRSFAVLDGLRGLAALLVVYHHEHLAGIVGAPSGAYLAVDLFFLMSGFVIAHAYEARLAAGLAPLAFMRLRLVRLYPLYLLGSVFGLVVAVAFGRLSALHPASWQELFATIASGAIMLPYFSADLSLVAFPLNGPAWSLFFELFVNLVYAVVAVRLSDRMLLTICGVSGCLLAVMAFKTGDLNFGFQSLGFFGGLPRVALSFFAGVLIQRLHRRGRLPQLSVSPLWALALGLGLLASPLAASVPVALVAVVIGFPTVLVLAVSAPEPPQALVRPFRLAGETSYPLYAVHGPIVVGLMMASRFWDWDLPSVRLAVGLLLPVVLAGAAFLLSRSYDQPVRAWLGRAKPAGGMLAAAT